VSRRIRTEATCPECGQRIRIDVQVESRTKAYVDLTRRQACRGHDLDGFRVRQIQRGALHLLGLHEAARDYA
jgi:hypothetical protein